MYSLVYIPFARDCTAATVQDSWTIGFQPITISYFSLGHRVALYFGDENVPFYPLWQVRQVGPALYHMRSAKWIDFYWKIETDRGKIYRVSKGSFGKSGGVDTELKHVLVITNPAGTPQQPGVVINLNFHQSVLSYDFRTGVCFAVEGDEITAPLDWNISQIEPAVYHLKFILFNNPSLSFWKIDARQKKMFAVKKGVFGSPGGEESPLPVAFTTTPSPGIKVEPGSEGRDVAARVSAGTGETVSPSSKTDLLPDKNHPEREQLAVELKFAAIQVLPEAGTVELGMSYSERSSETILLPQMQLKKVNDHVVQLKYKTWKNYFWQIDTQAKRGDRVVGGTFGVFSGEGKPLVNVDIITLGSDKNLPFFISTTNSPILSYVPDLKLFRISFNGDEISSIADWEIAKVAAGTYHFRGQNAVLHSAFWKIDAGRKTIFGARTGDFGSADVTGYALPWVVHTWGFEKELAQLAQNKGSNPTGASKEGFQQKDILQVSENGILGDVAAKLSGPDKPKSQWIENEKKFNHDLLKGEMYDLLVVPFQVQGYGIDRIGRSLMTRYLVHRLETSTGLRLPSPTLVARALGELSRRFSEEEIYRLANDLKVKTLIQGYVGHNRQGKMQLALLIQTRDKEDMLTPSTPVKKLTWSDIPFSDERLPSEMFYSLLDDVMSKLPVQQTRKTKAIVYGEEKDLRVPDSIGDLAAKKKKSPVENAFYLQMLGALYPNESPSRDSMFERSLVALSDISVLSPDYPILKARAYYYLNRRPAALAALKKGVGPEVKSLTDFLNGNLIDLEKSIDAIRRPIPRLIAQLDLNDLRWAYGNRVQAKKTYGSITKGLPGWEKVIIQRLQAGDIWSVQSNVEVKQALDKYFPIPDFTLKTLSEQSMLTGEVPYENDEILFSVYNHCRKYATGHKDKESVNESSSLIERDLLDLLDAIGETNLRKNAALTIDVRAEPDEGLALLARYDKVYLGHPGMTNLKADALSQVAYKSQGQIKENMDNQARDAQRNACYWFQGQTVGIQRRCASYNFFDGDYPRRSYWNWALASSPGDRESIESDIIKKDLLEPVDYRKVEFKNLELALRYTVMDFSYLEGFHRVLALSRFKHEAEELLKINIDRFGGSPDKVLLYGKLQEEKGNARAAEEIYESGIKTSPEAWDIYERLAKLYISQGEFKKASETSWKYPFFKTSNDNDVDTVFLSNIAFAAGYNLWWVGAFDEALPLFSFSARLDTGSGASMASALTLLLDQGKYREAAQGWLEHAKRYNGIGAYSRYVILLHLLGYHEQAWLIAKSRDIPNNLSVASRPIFVGHRMEAKTEEEQRQWLLRQDLKKNKPDDVLNYLLFTEITDRKPNENLPATLEAARKQIDPASASKERSEAAWFADGYNNLRLHLYSKAAQIFNERYYYQTFRVYAQPYYAYAAAKIGPTDYFEREILRLYKERNGEDFNYHLTQAILNSARKSYEQATKHLLAARAKVPWPSTDWFIDPWYELIETCEWLFEDSGYEGYRELLVKWAKICQKVRFEYAWAYAVEAKYTTSDTDRMRALAIALYLDKRSERISHFSNQEKKKALEWLKENNPFTPKNAERSKKDI